MQNVKSNDRTGRRVLLAFYLRLLSWYMKRIILFLLWIVFSSSVCSAQSAGKVLKLVSEHKGPVVSAGHFDVVASNNRSGFETGQVIKHNNIYNMFVNEMFDRPHRDLRIAYWTSGDAINWKRHATIVNSIPGRTPTNPRSEVWVSTIIFNEEEDAMSKKEN